MVSCEFMNRGAGEKKVYRYKEKQRKTPYDELQRSSLSVRFNEWVLSLHHTMSITRTRECKTGAAPGHASGYSQINYRFSTHGVLRKLFKYRVASRQLQKGMCWIRSRYGNAPYSRLGRRKSRVRESHSPQSLATSSWWRWWLMWLLLGRLCLVVSAAPHTDSWAHVC